MDLLEQHDDKCIGSMLHLNYCGYTESDLCNNDILRRYSQMIQYLYLKRNRIKSLSMVISQFPCLIQLHLEGNSIEELPQEIGGLKYLEILNVVSNNLTTLPRDIGDLQSLRVLQICNNRITSLPNELGKLCCLETLEASRNCLPFIPLTLSSCCKLKLLALDKNCIRQFPRQLCWLQNIKDISLAGNELEYLPPVIFKGLTSLECIVLDSNPRLHALPTHTTQQSVHVSSRLDKSRSDLFTYLNVRGEYFPLPREIKQYCVPHQSCVPCLEELVLQLLHRNIKQTSDIYKLPLPSDVKDHLVYPTAYCLQCNQPIFISAFPVIYSSTDFTLPVIEFFCSRHCTLQHSFHGNQVRFPDSL
ncbi:Leucine-rich repeat-containing protein 28 [Mactra antiquata]